MVDTLAGPWSKGVPDDDVDSHFEGAGRQYEVDPNLLRAMVGVESGGNPYAVSDQGAQGYAQIMPATQRELGVTDPWSKKQSVYGLAKYVRQNMDKFGASDLAVAAYHGGPNTAQWGPRTAAYVDKVGSRYAELGPAQRAAMTDEAPAAAPPKPWEKYGPGPSAQQPSQAQQPKPWEKYKPLGAKGRQPFALPSRPQAGQGEEGPDRKLTKQHPEETPEPTLDPGTGLPIIVPPTVTQGAQPVAKDGEPPDFTNQYNTPLSPDDEAKFQAWGKQEAAKRGGRNPAQDTFDYDMRGFWKSGEAFADNGHAGDQFKKPNHPTFSDQSQYSGKGGLQGGRWIGNDFQPSATNLKMHGEQGLADYFKREEPEGRLLPQQGTGAGLADVVASPEAAAADMPPGAQPTPAGKARGALGAVASKAAEAWGAAPIGMSAATEEMWRDAGILPIPGKGLQPLKQVNAAALRSLAAAWDVFARGGGAGFAAFQETLHQAGLQMGLPETLARDIAASPEAFFGMPGTIHAERRAFEMRNAHRAADMGEAGVANPPAAEMPALTRQAEEARARMAAQPAEPPPVGSGASVASNIETARQTAAEIRQGQGGADAQQTPVPRPITPEQMAAAEEAQSSPQNEWRPVQPGEVFEPGRSFRMNQTTGASEVFDPTPAPVAPDNIPTLTVTAPRPEPESIDLSAPLNVPEPTELQVINRMLENKVPGMIAGGSPPKRGIVPTMRVGSKIYYGEHGDTHAGLLDRYDLPFNARDEFALPGGRLVDRLELMQMDLPQTSEEIREMTPRQAHELYLNRREAPRPAASVKAAAAAVPPRIRTVDQIMTEDGVGRKKAEATQVEELLARGRPITQEEMEARRAGVAAPKPTKETPPTVENAGQIGPGKSEAVASENAGAGDGLPAGEITENPPIPRNATPYETVPKEPERLSSFIRRMGGVQDEGGDIRHSLGGSRFRPGLINKNGLPLDEMTMRAWQSGYMPDFADRPSINDLRDAIDDDVKGRPRYSAHDDASVSAYEDALGKNNEVDRLAAQHDIPTTGITRGQFFDQLHEKLSVEDQARLMEEQAAAHEGEYAAAQNAALDWHNYGEPAGERAAPRNPKDLYGQSQARTLKDLENEHGREQEAAATAAQQRDEGRAQPEPAGRGAGDVQEGGGPRGGGAGDDGRAGAQAPPTDLAGRPLAQPGAPRQAVGEPTIRNDARQDVMPGMEPSAVQAQAARDAQGRGALQTDVAQKPANEGLFAPDTSGQTSLYSFPGMLFDPAVWRRALGMLKAEADRSPYDVLREKKGISRKLAEVRAALAPTSVRGAKPMEYKLRRHNAEGAQAFDRSVHTLQQYRDAVDRLSKDAQVAFTHAMETGQAQPTPALQALSVALRGELDAWGKKVQSLGKGYLSNAIDNYMGHVWRNHGEWEAKRSGDMLKAAKAAESPASGIPGQGKRPLRGTGNFLKERKFPTQLEGMEAGLEPVTYNPVDLQLIKIREMQKFYHGSVLAGLLKDSGLAHWVRSTADDEAAARAAGWVQLDDSVFKPRMYAVNAEIARRERGIGHNGGPPLNDTMAGQITPGSYWAPEPLARVFNNYMSEGWHGRSSIYDGIRRTNNGMNALQLGLSGFHFSFVTLDTATSKIALGIQQLAAGHPIRGLGNIAHGFTIIPPVVSTVYRGAQLRKAWLNPELATPEMRKVVDYLKAGGGRVSMPEFYQSSASGAFYKHLSEIWKNPLLPIHQTAQMWRDADGLFAKAIGVPVRTAYRLLDQLNEPLMGAMVPRAKLGVFSDMAHNWMRDHPDATPEQVSAQMTKFMDSVDNRLGQLNYDNLFWNKTGKDLAFITTRSVGWNLGTVREIGGSGVDTAVFLRDAASGKRPEFTTRMAYTIAMTAVTAQIGAVMTYLFTGQPPQSLLDYFYPPTGGLTPDGQPERLSIPGYAKDVVAAWHDLPQTVLNKQAPLPSAATQILQNKDYYGGSIYDPELDAGWPQAYADYLANTQLPFSLRSFNRSTEEGGSALQKGMGFFGFQAAPKAITSPEKGAAFKAREAAKGYKRRLLEPGRLNIFNAPPDG